MNDIPEDTKEVLIRTYDTFRKTYASTDFDDMTSIRMNGTDRPTYDVHSSDEWVIISSSGLDETIDVLYKRNGIAGTPDRSKKIPYDEADVDTLMNAAKSFIDPSRVRKDGVVEENNPARVRQQVSEAREKIQAGAEEEKDGNEPYMLPYNTVGTMQIVANQLEELYPHVEYDEKDRSQSHKITVRATNTRPDRRGYVDPHSANWVIIEAEHNSSDCTITVRAKRGGIAGTSDMRQELTIEAQPKTLIEQAKQFMSPLSNY